MYRTFYPLLGQVYQNKDGKKNNVPPITKESLLIVDEMLVTTNRSDLKYNCTHHYLRVSDNHIVFNYYPFIDDKKDFMILMDFDKPDIYKNKSVNDVDFKNIEIKKRLIDIYSKDIEVDDKTISDYEKKKEELFDNLGNKDPDTIPRNLLLVLGKAKKESIKDDEVYVARNKRLKGKNIITWSDKTDSKLVNIIDLHYSQKRINEFIRRNDIKEMEYINTGLPVDKVYEEKLLDWFDRLESFYEEANLHQ